MNIILRLVKAHTKGRGSSFNLDRFQSLFQTSLSVSSCRKIYRKQTSLSLAEYKGGSKSTCLQSKGDNEKLGSDFCISISTIVLHGANHEYICRTNDPQFSMSNARKY